MRDRPLVLGLFAAVATHAQSVPGGGGLVEDADFDVEDELQAGTEQ